MVDIVVDPDGPGGFYGTPGIDTFIFSGTRDQYSVADRYFIGSSGERNVIVQYLSNPTFTWYLDNGEYLKFDDQIVPLIVQQTDTGIDGGHVVHDYDAHGVVFRTIYSYYGPPGVSFNGGSLGPQIKYDYDVLSQYSWSMVKTTYAAGMNQVRQVDYTNDDGTRSVYQYTDPYNTIESKFDVNGQRVQVNYMNDGHTLTTYQYDAYSAFSWDQIKTTFDGNGNRTQVTYNYDDHAATTYQYDVGNHYSWSQIQTNTNASGQTVKSLYTNDDGTSVLYQYDVDNTHSWSKQARYFDANGIKTKDVFDNNNGTHTLIQYDTDGNITNTLTYGGPVAAAGQADAATDSGAQAIAAASEQVHVASADQTSHVSGDSFVFRVDAQPAHEAASFVASVATSHPVFADLANALHNVASLVPHDDAGWLAHHADAAPLHLADAVAHGFLFH